MRIGQDEYAAFFAALKVLIGSTFGAYSAMRSAENGNFPNGKRTPSVSEDSTHGSREVNTEVEPSFIFKKNGKQEDGLSCLPLA
jgi:hypothetical protein